MNWQKFKRTYKREGIVLVLGAGVSLESGIPTWVELMRRMVTEKYDGNNEIFEALKAKGMSLTAVASLLEEKTEGGRKAFVEDVRKALYKDFEFFPAGVGKSNRTRFVKFIQDGVRREDDGTQNIPPNRTLHSVGAFCTAWKEQEGNKSPYFVNPRVKAIVTLNMDALLQSYVYARTTKHLLRTVDRPSAKLFPDRINIYHLHGYLHFDMRHVDRSRDKPAKTKRQRDAPDAVVLTEQDYYDFYNNPNGLFNYTFLYLLREYSCLFIGLSMDDENIRRLLHYSKMERMRALEKKFGLPLESITDEKERVRYFEELRSMCARHVAILARNGNTDVDRAQEQTLRPLGVSVAWVDKKYKDIPARLESLYKAAGDDWTKVY